MSAISSCINEPIYTSSTPPSAKSIQPDSFKTTFWTDAKIKKVALYALAGLAAATGCALTALGIVNIAICPFPLLSIPVFTVAASFFIGSGVLFHMAWKIKDYDNPREVEKMQQQALSLPFAELVKEHGLDRIQKFALVPQNVLQEKFREAFAKKQFSGMVGQYPLETIRKYNLLSQECLQEKFHAEFGDQSFFAIIAQYQLETILKYKLLPQEVMRGKYIEEIHAKMHDLFQKSGISPREMAEQCFRLVLTGNTTKNINGDTLLLLLPQVSELYSQFITAGGQFIDERRQLDQKYSTRTSARLSRLQSQRSATIENATREAEKRAHDAAEQARAHAVQLNRAAQLQHQTELAAYSTALAARQHVEASNAADIWRHGHHIRSYRFPLPVPFVPLFPFSPGYISPASTHSASYFMAQDTSLPIALASIDEAMSTIRDNKIGSDEQAAYEREIEAVKQAYGEKIIPLSARLKDTITSLRAESQ